MNSRLKILLPLVISFILLTVLIIVASLLFSDSGIDYLVLMLANCLFFLASLAAFAMQRKALANANPNVFIRSVMKAVMLKMGVCVLAVMAYVLLSGKYFNRPAVFISMAFYLVYLVVEVAVVMKMNKAANA